MDSWALSPRWQSLTGLRGRIDPAGAENVGAAPASFVPPKADPSDRGLTPVGRRRVATNNSHSNSAHPHPVSDEELVVRYRKGDSPAFEELVRRHHDDLIRFLIRLVGNRAVAEDAFQDTFLQVHLSADTFDTTRRFKPWLFTIAANKARDALRRSARRKTLDLSAPISGGGGGGGNGPDSGARTYVDLMEVDVPQPDQQLNDKERNDAVQRAVDELPWSLREILLLAYFQRLSYNQIADTLEIPLGTVKSRLHSAVAAFAKKLRQVSSETSHTSNPPEPDDLR